MKDELTGAAEALRGLGVVEASTPDQRSKSLVRSSTFARYRPKADQISTSRSLGRLLVGGSDPKTGEHGREHQQRIASINCPRVRSGVPKFPAVCSDCSGKKE